MSVTACRTLAGALGLGPAGLVAFVGAGGKTSAMRLLADELVSDGRSVIATTTTAMLVHEMEALGPMTRLAGARPLPLELSRTLSESRRAAIVKGDGKAGKVVGLPPRVVDGLWADQWADFLVVEADGSRGLPFKAFGPHEPQVPAMATTIVDVVGLDVLGTPLAAEHVHRAALLAETLDIPMASEVTAAVLAAGLRAHVARLRQTRGSGRIAVLLNKAESSAAEAAGLEVAQRLLGRAEGPGTGHERTAAAESERERPDCVVVGSVWTRRFLRVTEQA